MSLFFGRSEKRSMQSWIDSDGFVTRPTDYQATFLSPVYAAIRHIVDYGSTLPVDFFRKIDEGVRQPAPTPRLLSRQDDPGGIGMEQWFGQALYGIAVHGNAVAWVTEHDGWGYPMDAIWLQRHWWNWNQIEKRWYVLGSPAPFSNIIHIPWLVPTGTRLGMSPIEHYASIVSAGLSAQEYADMKRGGGLPPMVLKNSEQTLDKGAAEQISDRLASRLALGKPFVSGKDWDLSSPAIPPNHAQFIETLKMTANQIAAIYGLEPTEVGGEASNRLEYSTEELRQLRRASDLRPYLVRIERAINRVLPNRQYMQFNVDATLRTDVKTRTDVLGEQISDGRLSVNEARALEDRLPVEGGDFHNVPTPQQQVPSTR